MYTVFLFLGNTAVSVTTMTVKPFGEVVSEGFSARVPEGFGAIVSEVVGEAISAVKIVEVKLGIGVNVPVGKGDGVDEGSIDGVVVADGSVDRVDVAAGVVPSRGFSPEPGLGDEGLRCSGSGRDGRHAVNNKAEARAILPARVTLFMPFLCRGNDLHEL
jgi:hypothetical protein